MILALTLLTLGGGIACVVSSLRRRNWCDVLAASLMLASMFDAHFTRLIPVVYWASGLVLITLLLGLRLRTPKGEPSASNRGSQRMSRDRALETTTILAYPVMAWLLLAHAANISQSLESSRPSHHLGHGLHPSAAPLAMAIVLTAILAALTLLAARRRSHATGDSGGMTVMLAAMLVPV